MHCIKWYLSRLVLQNKSFSKKSYRGKTLGGQIRLFQGQLGLGGSTLLLLLQFLPKAASAGQHLPLHLPKNLTTGTFSRCQSLILPRLMVRYSWWRQSLEAIFMATNFPHSIFDPLSCTGTQWIVDKVVLKHFLHSVLWHSHSEIFIRLQPSNSLSMYAIQSALPSTFRGLYPSHFPSPKTHRKLF